MNHDIYEYGNPVNWKEGLSPLEWPDNQPLSIERYSVLTVDILREKSTLLWDLNPKPGDIVRVTGNRDHGAIGVFIGHLQDQSSLDRGESLTENNILYRIKAFSTGKYSDWGNADIVKIY